jgi:hypothetical protein
VLVRRAQSRIDQATLKMKGELEDAQASEVLLCRMVFRSLQVSVDAVSE